jgi:hypothetical protein
VVPEEQWLRQDAEPARVVAGPVDPFESHAHDFGITSTGTMAEDFGRIGLAASEHLTYKVGLSVGGRDISSDFAAVVSE